MHLGRECMHTPPPWWDDKIVRHFSLHSGGKSLPATGMGGVVIDILRMEENWLRFPHVWRACFSVRLLLAVDKYRRRTKDSGLNACMWRRN